jgi:hypothetical protein
MYALKALSHEGVASALAKAEHYRSLKESAEAESICRDILAIEPENQQALICLLLAQSDQIARDPRIFNSALASVQKLHGDYERAYYAGIVWERRAKALHEERSRGGTHHSVYEWIVKALHCFEEAEGLRSPGNDDAVLRWNTCVRFLARHPTLVPRGEEAPEPIVSE